MLLVLWTLYSVSALAFRAVSTSGCGVLFVFWAETCNFGILTSGANWVNVFPVFPDWL